MKQFKTPGYCLTGSEREFWPVFHIRHVAMKPDATFFLPGTAGSRIHPNVGPLTGEDVITKNYPNAFRDTALLNLLKKIDIQELVICGMMTPYVY